MLCEASAAVTIDTCIDFTSLGETAVLTLYHMLVIGTAESFP